MTFADGLTHRYSTLDEAVNLDHWDAPAADVLRDEPRSTVSPSGA